MTTIKVQTELTLPGPVFDRLADMRRDMNHADISETIVSVLCDRFRLQGSEASRLLDSTQESIVRRALEAGVVTDKELRDEFGDSAGNHANVSAVNRKLRARLGDRALVRNEEDTGFMPNPAVLQQLRAVMGIGEQHDGQ